MMSTSFLDSYLQALPSLDGWFSPDAALMFLAYNQIIASHEITGDTLEIGVHHGKSAIAIAALRGQSNRFVAIDLFEELQSDNTSGSGSGSRDRFVHNMRAHLGDLAFVQIIQGSSMDLTPECFEGNFSFCHIDGGHSAEETCHDLELCADILRPGGIVALDDYFNEEWPGVSEGAIRFMLHRPSLLVPFAIGYNKVMFQKAPVPFGINKVFARTFKYVPCRQTVMWGSAVNLFPDGLVRFFDLPRSTPSQLQPIAYSARVGILPQSASLAATAGRNAEIGVRVVNQSEYPVPLGTSGTPAGLSYHVLAPDGSAYQWENNRAFFEPSLGPFEERLVMIPIMAPSTAGVYTVEFDIVWENKMWFREIGNPTSTIELVVS